MGWNTKAGHAAAGALAASVLRGAPVQAQALESLGGGPGFGVFVGLSVYPKVQFNYGFDLRYNDAPGFYVRFEGYGIERWFLTAGAFAEPMGVPFVGDLGISLGIGGGKLTPALSVGPSLGYLFGGLQLNGLIPLNGDWKSLELGLRLYGVSPQIEQFLGPHSPTGRLLRHNDGHELPNMVPDQEVPFELRMAEPDLERGLLAVHWHVAARTEGGAVASFDRLSRELIALEAPRGLIRASARAAREEERHAALCSRLSARCSGLRWRPTTLHVPPRWHQPSPEGFAAVAQETLEDGLLAEGASAAIIARAAARAGDPETRDALAAIARDETGHVELGWATLEWLWHEGGPAARDAIVQASETAVPSTRGPARPGDSKVLARYGVLTSEEEADITDANAVGVRRRVTRLMTRT